MTRSPYAVTSALAVACPECCQDVGQVCIDCDGKPMKRSHPARRRLADEKRTREVNPKVMKP